MISCGVADGVPGGVVGDAPGGASIQSMSMKSPSGVAWRSRR
jgi:hypothetical protein